MKIRAAVNQCQTVRSGGVGLSHMYLLPKRDLHKSDQTTEVTVILSWLPEFAPLATGADKSRCTTQIMGDSLCSVFSTLSMPFSSDRFHIKEKPKNQTNQPKTNQQTKPNQPKPN